MREKSSDAVEGQCCEDVSKLHDLTRPRPVRGRGWGKRRVHPPPFFRGETPKGSRARAASKGVGILRRTLNLSLRRASSCVGGPAYARASGAEPLRTTQAAAHEIILLRQGDLGPGGLQGDRVNGSPLASSRPERSCAESRDPEPAPDSIRGGGHGRLSRSGGGASESHVWRPAGSRIRDLGAGYLSPWIRLVCAHHRLRRRRRSAAGELTAEEALEVFDESVIAERAAGGLERRGARRWSRDPRQWPGSWRNRRSDRVTASWRQGHRPCR